MEPKTKKPVESTEQVADSVFSDEFVANFREIIEDKKVLYVEDEWDNIHGDIFHF
jgi:hypothetical protein